MSQRGERGGKHREPDQKLRQVAHGVGAEMRAELRQVRPLRRRHRQPADARAVGEQRVSDDDDAKPEPDRPPIFFAPELAPAQRRRCRDRALDFGDVAHLACNHLARGVMSAARHGTRAGSIRIIFHSEAISRRVKSKIRPHFADGVFIFPIFRRRPRTIVPGGLALTRAKRALARGALVHAAPPGRGSPVAEPFHRAGSKRSFSSTCRATSDSFDCCDLNCCGGLDFGLCGKDEGGLTGAPAEGSVKAARLSLFFLPGRIALSRRQN